MFTLEPQSKPTESKCKVCGRTLTDPESILRGKGPVCSGTSSKCNCLTDPNQISFDWTEKPELVICMNTGDQWLGFDAGGRQIVSGKTETDFAANILGLFTGDYRGLEKGFAERFILPRANRGVIRREAVEKFIREWGKRGNKIGTDS